MGLTADTADIIDGLAPARLSAALLVFSIACRIGRAGRNQQVNTAKKPAAPFSAEPE
jgi:hypothetical protein